MVSLTYVLQVFEPVYKVNVVDRKTINFKILSSPQNTLGNEQLRSRLKAALTTELNVLWHRYGLLNIKHNSSTFFNIIS